MIDQQIAKHPRPEGRTTFVSFGPATRVAPGSYCADDTFLPYEVKHSREEGLDRGGLVKLIEIKPCGDWDVELTDLAKKDALSFDSSKTYASIVMGTYRSYHVTGIVQDGPHATVNVDLIYAMTPSGKAMAAAGVLQTEDSKDKCRDMLQDGTILCSGSMAFTRFDDGWRIGDSEGKIQ
jgi:hypothetical protein